MFKKPKAKYQVATLLCLAMALFGLPLLSPAAAADGANGYIQSSAQIFHISGGVISISMWNLDPSSDYHLNWTGENTGVTFTTAATQTTYTYTFALSSTSTAVVFYLRAGTAGTTIDSVQVTVFDISAFLATGLIISAGIFVLIVVIFKRVVKK